ncbi:MAG: alpha/beta fold hydrolase [Cellulosilyticaceae bacterium]
MGKLLKGLMYLGGGIMLVLTCILCIVLIRRCIKAEQIKIKTPNGIQEKVYVNLGGIEQYIQIRGEDKSNPVIIFLHGGPGNTISHLAYYYQPYLEANYTIVNWDQRGSGRTYYRNEDLDVKTQLSTEILLEDLDDLVDYTRETLGQEKVIIMGHSWGTLLGSKYVLAHPEKVESYIGIGQAVSLKEGYLYSSYEAIKKAEAQGDTKVAQALAEATERFANTHTLEDFDFNDFIKMQQYSMKYNAYDGAVSTFEMIDMLLTSPELSWEDIKWFFKTSDYSQVLAMQGPLVSDCFFGFNIYDIGSHYEVPVHYITGTCDVSTPADLTEAYYETVVAPHKSMTQVPDAGHLIFFDDPQGFSEVVKQLLSGE